MDTRQRHATAQRSVLLVLLVAGSTLLVGLAFSPRGHREVGAGAIDTPTVLSNLVPAIQPVTYPAGWNLVAGAMATFAGTDAPVYTWDADRLVYRPVDTTAPLDAAHGYWVHFPQSTTVNLPLGGGFSAVPLPPGQWVLVGQPAFPPCCLSGADVLFTFEPATQRYQQATQLAVGQGAWAYSARGALFSQFAEQTPPAP